MNLKPAIPVLRIFDVDLAKAFYVDWLGFTLDWAHEFGPTFPKYLQVSRDALILHLSEHYGDGSPGAKLLINLDDVDSLHAELATRPNPRMRPGVEVAPWNARVMEVIDPFGNRLVFNQNLDLHPLK
ncbi:MAG TPA: glyoxalase superfamily protein [Rhodocyclaceae bacterium]|nr:glyoxalase superfamily protein [Rhodocyclaceae bacterium]